MIATAIRCRNKACSRYLLTALLLLFVSAGSAESLRFITFTGFVKPSSGARLERKAPGGSWVATSIGKSLDLPAGRWQFRASAPGYQTQVKTITLGANASVSCTFALVKPPPPPEPTKFVIGEFDPPYAEVKVNGRASIKAGQVIDVDPGKVYLKAYDPKTGGVYANTFYAQKGRVNRVERVVVGPGTTFVILAVEPDSAVITVNAQSVKVGQQIAVKPGAVYVKVADLETGGLAQSVYQARQGETTVVERIAVASPGNPVVSLVSVEPEDVLVTVNGRHGLDGEREWQVAPGTVDVVIMAEGYATWEATRELGNGEEWLISAVLRPLMGRLQVNIEPGELSSTSTVTLDGKIIKAGEWMNLPPGDYSIEVQPDTHWYETYSADIKIAVGDRTSYVVKPTRVPHGEVEISVGPPEAARSARVALNGVLISAGSAIKAPPGHHDLSVGAPGYATHTEQLRILNTPVRERRQITLLSLPDSGMVSVAVEPAAAKILIDGLPMEQNPSSVSVGKHKITAQMQGYLAKDQEVIVGAGQTVPCTMKLSPDPIYGVREILQRAESRLEGKSLSVAKKEYIEAIEITLGNRYRCPTNQVDDWNYELWRARTGLGHVYIEMAIAGRRKEDALAALDDALSILQQAVETLPDRSLSRYLLGWTLTTKGRYDSKNRSFLVAKAIAEYKQALVDDPRQCQLMMDYAVALALNSQLAEAKVMRLAAIDCGAPEEYLVSESVLSRYASEGRQGGDGQGDTTR